MVNKTTTINATNACQGRSFWLLNELASPSLNGLLNNRPF